MSVAELTVVDIIKVRTAAKDSHGAKARLVGGGSVPSHAMGGLMYVVSVQVDSRRADGVMPFSVGGIILSFALGELVR
jgi:hypothetical protein